ncbi:biliverdin-producing heme oxygenase [Pseudonocardiaceae bacterium YIM PH 21723]|nr:biliverdin-producing heme oxygenase [Pseudonocardiaceae bacterium YIM PH 21723]
MLFREPLRGGDMTTTAEAEPGLGFATRLRTETAEDHRRAEDMPFAGLLSRGQVTREQYTTLHGQLFFIYRTLEEAAEAMRNDPVAGPFVHDGLNRVPALRADLDQLLGEGWEDGLEPISSVQAYVDRLRAVCFDWPGGFVAHHYLRYMGDLFGGQIIRTHISRNLGLNEATGLSFYTFPAEFASMTFKRGYRELLDTTPFTESDRNKIVQEVALGFALNSAMFDQLGR